MISVESVTDLVRLTVEQLTLLNNINDRGSHLGNEPKIKYPGSITYYNINTSHPTLGYEKWYYPIIFYPVILV